MAKILLIEDDPVVQTLILKILRAEGFEAIAAVDGYEGMAVVQQQHPDLILCDVMMPLCDGYEVLQQLNQNPNTAGIPFIFLTSKSAETDRRQGMNLGADDYLSKPFRREELLRAITARLTKREAVLRPLRNEMSRATATLEHVAYQDKQTLLPNHAWFLRQLNEAIALTSTPASVLSVLLIHLDPGSFNRTHGSATAHEDEFLQQVTQRLRDSFGDDHSLAYLGHCKFGLLIRNLSHDCEAEQTARVLLRILREPYTLRYSCVEPEVSIGIAPGETAAPGCTGDYLAICAELAMKRAERKMGNHLALYDPAQDVAWTDPKTIIEQLTRASFRNEFTLQYQPQLNLITGKVVGAEALLRWNHPTLGSLQPASFLSIAEDAHLLPEIGDWVMKTACRHAKEWQDRYHLSLRVAINVSLSELQQPNFFEKTAQNLREMDLDPDLLAIELSETCLIGASPKVMETLQRLHHIGVNLYLDDVGAAFSSFSHLRKAPLQALKIDGGLIATIAQPNGEEALVQAVLGIAHTLSLKAIAEGVERPEQLGFLRKNGCHAAQGDIYSPPVTAREFEILLAKDRLQAST